MDNNNSGRPRKKVTKKILRRRQLTALAVIALVLLIFIILIANACTDKSQKPKDEKTSTTTTTTTTTTTEPVTEPPTTMTTTTPVPAVDPTLSAQVQLSTREISLNVGENDMPVIYGYPEGSAEANEIWESSDPNIATVSNIGDITAVNPGECYVILKFDNNPAIEVQIKVTVSGDAAPETPSDNQQDINADMNIPDNQDTSENIQSYQGYQDTQGYRDTQNYQENPIQPDTSADDITGGIVDDTQN